ncbi:actin protein 10 [Pelomyxa schiedti]|nr:actin protein 10 [Pelomyxa schiedti]
MSRTGCCVAVLQTGSRYTRLGVAGELHPRAIMGPLPSDPRLLFLFLRDAFIDTLFTSPSDCIVVVCENLMTPTPTRQLLASTLLRKLGSRSLHFVQSECICALTPCPTIPFRSSAVSVSDALPSPDSLGTEKPTLAVTDKVRLSQLDNLLVVDIGYCESRVLPVCHGYAVTPALETSHIGMKSILRNLRETMESSGEIEGQRAAQSCNGVTTLWEEILSQCCFVQPKEDSGASPPPSAKSTPGQVHWRQARGVPYVQIAVPASVRSAVFEPLFKGDDDAATGSLQRLILDSLLKCPIDLRYSLAQNILLIGGGSNAPGIHWRLSQELTSCCQLTSPMIPNYRPLTSLHWNFPQTHTDTPVHFSGHLMSWVGASLYSTTISTLPADEEDSSEPKPNVVTLQSLDKNGLPDWTKRPIAFTPSMD